MILVFGKKGQVAQELTRIGLDAVFLDRDAVDLCDPEACATAIRAHHPAIVINAAAYTAVDAAETDEEAARQVNAAAPGAMARAAAELGIPFLHISTDYVFDGSGARPWMPEDPMRPLCAYGRTKAEGEAAIREAGGRHLILRTSWVFSAHGANFVKTMLRLSETRDSLRVVADQVGGPTAAADIARTCADLGKLLIDGAPGGTYHFAGAPDTSWADFAREIFHQAGRQVAVAEIPTTQYSTPATRPLNSRLDCAALKNDFSIARPDWRQSLALVLKELGARA